jgi:signal transduction histidine kinase
MFLLVTCYANGIIKKITCTNPNHELQSVPGTGIHTLVKSESMADFGAFWGKVLQSNAAKISKVYLHTFLTEEAAEGFGIFSDHEVILTFIPADNSQEHLLHDMVRMNSEQQNALRLNQKKLAQLQYGFGQEYSNETYLKDFSRLNNELINQQRQLTLLNRELENVNRKLKQSNESLEQLNYSISHDLKEPIRTMSGMSQLLVKQFDSSLPERAKKYVTVIEQAAAKAQRMITDLVVFFKETQNGSTRPVPVNDLLNQVNSLLAYLFEERSVQLEIQLEQSVLLPAVFVQVLQNLIVNAIKYTPIETTPTITISVFRQDNWIELRVKDNGVGISESQQLQLFKLFHRIDNNLNTDGSGIGLSIVKSIVESHGGSISVISQLEKGSTFIVRIPAVF